MAEQTSEVHRDPVADKLAALLQDPSVAKAVVDNPNSHAAKILIEANVISLNADLAEQEAKKAAGQG